MINTYAYDVEVLPNFFSVTIINVAKYLETFKDCVNSKNKPIPIIQCISVNKLKKRLEQVEKHKFYITDTDDSQLLSMLGFINSMRPYYDELNAPVRSDWFGYNSNSYDKLMIAGLLMYSGQTNSSKELITKLYELSKHIISIQDNEEMRRHDYTINTCSKYPLPFVNIDIMTIFALNKVGSMIDDKGEKKYFGKSLKQTSINLQWYELLEYELPPISYKDISYYEKDYRYKGLSPDKVNQLVSKWDRYIIDEWIEPTMHYNENDVFIVCEMIRLFIDEIRLRYSLSHTYKIDLLSSSRSNIADKLFIKFYSEFSGLAPEQWRGKITERTSMSFKRVIFDWINFKTKPLQELLAEMKQVTVYSTGMKALKEVSSKYPNFKYLKTNTNNGWFEITINNLTYTIATGGLHSKDIPRELKSKIEYIDVPSTGGQIETYDIWDKITDDSYIYVHFDIASFYPSIISVYKIAPKHLTQSVFTKLITWLKDTRVKAKHSSGLIDGVPSKILAEALKIVINSIYGKLGFTHGDLCDRLTVLQVTINGQLMIMMLCEELEMNGIEVMSANTDGIVVKLYKKDKHKFNIITNNWMKLTGLGADSEEYLYYINRDINNYFIEEINGKTDAKGALNEFMYIKDLSKGYDMPIVARAVVNYFKGIPILETLYASNNILDFCKTQNISKNYHIEIVNQHKNIILQRNIRYYIANSGDTIIKVKNDNPSTKSSLCSGYRCKVLNTLDDTKIAYRNINYSYYYNEALKIIDTIKLSISPKQKGGKSLIKKYSGQYNSLFEDLDYE